MAKKEKEALEEVNDVREELEQSQDEIRLLSETLSRATTPASTPLKSSLNQSPSSLSPLSLSAAAGRGGINEKASSSRSRASDSTPAAGIPSTCL